jgi:hypothetical protein
MEPAPDFWSDAAVKARMQRGWATRETICGPGSTQAMAYNASEWLSTMVYRHRIGSLANIGAGDLNWWPSKLDELCAVAHYDLIPRVDGVIELDITKQMPAPAEAAVLRHVLIHFDPPRVRLALANIREAGIEYLFASQYEPGAPFKGTDCTLYDLRDFIGHEPSARTTDAQGGRQTLAMWVL